MTQCRALTFTPGDRCTQVHDEPESNSVTFQTSFAIPGCLIENCLPTAKSEPSWPSNEVTDSVQSGQCSTSLKIFHTNCAGASIATLSSVIMYQMVHENAPWARGDFGVRTGGSHCGCDTRNTTCCVAAPCRTPGVVSVT